MRVALDIRMDGEVHKGTMLLFGRRFVSCTRSGVSLKAVSLVMMPLMQRWMRQLSGVQHVKAGLVAGTTFMQRRASHRRETPLTHVLRIAISRRP